MVTNVRYILRDVLGLKNTQLMEAYRMEGRKMEQSQVTRLVNQGIKRYDKAEELSKILEKYFDYVTTPEQLIGYRRGI
jgi:ABC-type amino acid transport substrate-binding protein